MTGIIGIRLFQRELEKDWLCELVCRGLEGRYFYATGDTETKALNSFLRLRGPKLGIATRRVTKRKLKKHRSGKHWGLLPIVTVAENSTWIAVNCEVQPLDILQERNAEFVLKHGIDGLLRANSSNLTTQPKNSGDSHQQNGFNITYSG